jgi:DNA-binding response OmpR family regulator
MNPNKKFILVVEDEAPLQEALKLKLTKAGFDVFIADSGEDALELLKEINPSLILLDILLPGMNGLEFLRKIRNRPEYNGLPIVIISVSGGSEKIKEAFSLGATDYLVKSAFTVNEIVDEVLKIVNPNA